MRKINKLKKQQSKKNLSDSDSSNSTDENLFILKEKAHISLEKWIHSTKNPIFTNKIK